MRHLTFATEASYASVQKTNDNTGSNQKGRERQLSVEFRVHLPHYWFAGPVASWEGLNTSNYGKSSWHPGIGGGYNFPWMRLGSDFLMAGSDRLNGAQAIVITAFFPSPERDRSHVFFRERIEIYRFHSTVTDWQSASLTRLQLSDHAWGNSVEMSVGVRF